MSLDKTSVKLKKTMQFAKTSTSGIPTLNNYILIFSS